MLVARPQPSKSSKQWQAAGCQRTVTRQCRQRQTLHCSKLAQAGQCTSTFSSSNSCYIGSSSSKAWSVQGLEMSTCSSTTVTPCGVHLAGQQQQQQAGLRACILP
jgi:hypothetical protein